ncbi:LuxR C-terminal-related transcriptional regulator [Variovorax dokdonensis]|uniref:LuxR C-terminal-related transcriptional regulator n=1 Tax=Variovorax dokdonensis TaxID=344883 RepID=A0ABT7N9S8_9BURK|nr:PAS and helix-turn-helix domain-containing protein [Variovorax dokdonensis]MDM0044699.1 LuxR C-terminal-related transcriptional regulator [Variovorax dokdonensis]
MVAPVEGQAMLLARVLDEIDHGLIVVDLTGRILHVNQPAQAELSAARTLCDREGMLHGSDDAAQRKIRQALRDAGDDVRAIVDIEGEGQPMSLAFVPMPSVSGRIDAVLIMCSKRQNCASLTMQMFARANRLTRAEQQVLRQLCDGHRAEEIAGLQGVRVSTVRTHIKSVREKTGSNSVREIVHRLSRMPQVVAGRGMAIATND